MKIGGSMKNVFQKYLKLHPKGSDYVKKHRETACDWNELTFYVLDKLLSWYRFKQ